MFISTVLFSMGGLLTTANAFAQTAPAPAAAPAAAAPAAAAPAPQAAPPAPTPVAAAPAAPATPPPVAPAAPAEAGHWWDKFAADAFVDAYGAVDWSQNPKFPPPFSQAPVRLRQFDVAQGFALNWAGVNASYSSDTIGGTVGLRFGPGAAIYNSGSDDSNGLMNVKQAYATWKAIDKLTLDFGKWDEPFGSEVADSQLNMNYSRSILFTYAQPLFFTGLRADYAASDQLDVKVFAVNGWNNSIDNNRGKTFGGQVMVKPADMAVLYLGYAGGPEQNDVVAVANPATGSSLSDVAGGNSNWRHLVDFVADINPTKELRFLLNADYLTEEGLGNHSAVVYGANLVARYNVTDAFNAALRGGYLHDEHGDRVTAGLLPAGFVGLPNGASANVEDITLSLNYGIGNHLAFMLDNRVDITDYRSPGSETAIFYAGANTNDTYKTQFTTTLGIIASTK
jgi:hypothetical protein